MYCCRDTGYLCLLSRAAEPIRDLKRVILFKGMTLLHFGKSQNGACGYILDLFFLVLRCNPNCYWSEAEKHEQGDNHS